MAEVEALREFYNPHRVKGERFEYDANKDELSLVKLGFVEVVSKPTSDAKSQAKK